MYYTTDSLPMTDTQITALREVSERGVKVVVFVVWENKVCDFYDLVWENNIPYAKKGFYLNSLIGAGRPDSNMRVYRLPDVWEVHD